MQASKHAGLPRRARLYSSRLTNEAWSDYVKRNPDSYDYSMLPRVAVIFVCDFDPFKARRRHYTGRMVYEDAEHIDDGALAVLLNARGHDSDSLDPDLAAFLDYVAGRDVTRGRSAFVDKVDHAVMMNNGDSEFREGLMQIGEKLWLSKQEGLEEGEAKGRAEGAAGRQRKIAELARRMAADGRQDDIVATLTNDQRLEEELRRYDIE